jgi:hypothetical protein
VARPTRVRGRLRMRSSWLLSAMSRRERSQQIAPLLNYLVGAGVQHGRNVNAEIFFIVAPQIQFGRASAPISQRAFTTRTEPGSSLRRFGGRRGDVGVFCRRVAAGNEALTALRMPECSHANEAGNDKTPVWPRGHESSSCSDSVPSWNGVSSWK